MSANLKKSPETFRLSCSPHSNATQGCEGRSGGPTKGIPPVLAAPGGGARTPARADPRGRSQAVLNGKGGGGRPAVSLREEFKRAAEGLNTLPQIYRHTLHTAKSSSPTTCNAPPPARILLCSALCPYVPIIRFGVNQTR